MVRGPICIVIKMSRPSRILFDMKKSTLVECSRSHMKERVLQVQPLKNWV